jgi:hypothetical protein
LKSNRCTFGYATLTIAKPRKESDPMATPASLAIGQHLLFADPAVRWDVQFSDTNPPSVVLTASMQVGPSPPIFPPPHGETSVAVQMDARVALQLYEQLGDLIRSMGWQKHVTGGRAI